MNREGILAKLEGAGAEQKLEAAGMTALRLALATNILWIGALKFREYEAKGVEPMISTSPLFSKIYEKLGLQKTSNLIGATELAVGAMIAAKPLAPRVSAVGSLGAVGMFSTTLSFLFTMPGVWQEGYGKPWLSQSGGFLLKDGVLLGAALLTAAESLRDARRR